LNHSVIDKYEFIFNDVTRSKLIEEKNAEFKYKNLFLSKVAHEFKNPLLCICELVDQISEEIKSAERVNEILKQIKSMSNYLIILIKDLDYFSQKNNGIIKTVDIDNVSIDGLLKFCTDIITGLIKKAHKENNIKFDIIKSDIVPKYIQSDEIKLKQILVNLLSNSVKYTQSGNIALSLSIHEDNLQFKVDDTGKGLSKQQQEKIFIPFSNEFDKLNKVSSGLGLSIVKELTELLNSTVEFKSEIGKGSSFWFEIPLISSNQRRFSEVNKSVNSNTATIEGIHFSDRNIEHILTRENAHLKGDLVAHKPKKEYLVIIVDDEIITRQSTIRLLSSYLKTNSYNATIVEASDGIECLYKYMLLYKEGKRIDFILSDESMEFMNGSTCAEILWNTYQIKNLNPIPFYIISAYETLNLGRNDGIIGMFTKPMRRQNFDDILKKYF
jgi:two-component sensor histidine kinase/CheY-like chemotaxis protein